MLSRPTFEDVLVARQVVNRYLVLTPLYFYPALSRLVGADIYVKHENYQRLGAFKVRGGVNLVSRLSPEERGRGVITASTGNHGQSIAYACQLFGAKAIVVVPEGANPGKVESMTNLGAEVVFYGKDGDESKDYAEKLAQERGYHYVHFANEPHLIAGVATYSLEIVEDLPEAEVIMVPLGGGSGACGACIVAQAVKPSLEVIAVQSERAPGGYLSWKSGQIQEAPMQTISEGLATRMGYELPQGILRDFLTDFLLVSDEEILRAIVLYLEKAHTLAEEAGAAPLAAALKIKKHLQGRKVVLVLSGGNISPHTLRRALSLPGLSQDGGVG